MHTSASTPGLPQADPFAHFYREHFGFVRAVVTHYGVQGAVADDATQDVFVTALRKQAELGFEVSARSWLYGVARRIAFRYRRSAERSARRHAALALWKRDRTDPRSEQDAARLVQQLLATLPEEQRMVVLLADYLGMTAREIAGELSVPENTVYSRLRLARAKLQSGDPPADLSVVRAAAERSPQFARARRRVWAALVPLAGAGALAPGAASAGLLSFVPAAWSSKTVATTVGVALVGAGMVVGVGKVVEASGPRSSAAASVTASVPDVRRAPPPRTEASRAASEAALIDAAAQEAELTSPSPRAAQRSAVPPRSEEPDRGDDAELRRLAQARRALGEGDPTASLRVLDAHAQAVPQSKFADLREAMRVEALCASGRRVEGLGLARALRKRFPAAGVVRAAEEKCRRRQ